MMKETKGLTDEQVKERIQKGLVNSTDRHQYKSERKIIFDNVFTYFNFLNISLFVLVLCTLKIKNGLFIGTVIFNTGIGIFQEIRAKRLLEKMSILVETKIPVLRNGDWQKISSNQLVNDDVIQVKEGMQIPADCVILEGKLELNESILSGESDTVLKKPGEEIFSGTDVAGGMAIAQVLRVGRNCAASKIMEEAEKLIKAKSQLYDSLDKMIRIISYAIIPFMVILYLEHVYILDLNWDEAILKMVAAVIGMIPEGLVVLTTIALTVSSIRLSQKSVLVQDLFSIETIARVDTVCLDKTGTLTKGSLSMEKMACFSGFEEGKAKKMMRMFLKANNSVNATQQALLEYFGMDENADIVETLPFDSQRKFSAVSFSDFSLYVGAYSFLFPDGNQEVEDYLHKESTGQFRNLICAKSTKINVSDGLLPDDLQPVALLQLKDDLRENSKETISFLYQEGVDIRILSGDDPLTVSNIAKTAGVRNSERFIDVSKTDIPTEELVKEYTVFGRVLPQQKKEIINALKKQGHTVAMTGDGVNDVPALKSADMSIAMASGTSAAKNSSNAVLLNDDFGVVPDMIREGRRVINNISRASSMYLVKTVFSLLLSLTVILTGQPYPFLPVHLTIISAFGVGIPTFFLQMEPSFEKVGNHFFFHSFLKALPSSLTIYFSAIACLGLKRFAGISGNRFYGVFVTVTSFIYLYTLWQVYKPLSKNRMAVIGGMALMYILTYCVFGKYLYISFEKWDIVITVIMILCVPFCIEGLKFVVRKTVKRYVRRK